MPREGWATRVGIGGYVASAALAVTAALVVAGGDSAAPIEWDPSLVIADGASGALPPVDDRALEASHQELLVVGLGGVPGTVQAGDVIRLGVELRNDSDVVVSLDPCPTYRVTFSRRVGGSFTEQRADDVLVEMLGRFRCDGSTELEPGQRVRLEMPFEIDGKAFRALQTDGAITFELSPRDDLVRPRSMVGGVTVEQPDAFIGGVPPGLGIPPQGVTTLPRQ